LGYFFQRKSYVFISTKLGLGYILGEFFTNSSGHPACQPLPLGKVKSNFEWKFCFNFKMKTMLTLSNKLEWRGYTKKHVKGSQCMDRCPSGMANRTGTEDLGSNPAG
jgi:hypothetical protein